MNSDELEVKFYLTDLRGFESRLRAKGANRVTARTYELNLRFDLPGDELSKDHRVLRLRQDVNAHMTYKGPSQDREGVTARQEIEFEVSDFQAARRLLEALGYAICVSYEKYRTTYDLEGVKITIDEMPYGQFCEVEGPNPAVIQSVSGQLGLDWSTRIMDSYLMLFGSLKKRLGLQMRDLTFENFAGTSVSAEDLGVKVADLAR